jgi:IrrE N-terminal-like domain
MTDHGRKPHRWANDLNKIMAAAFGEGHLPVPLELVATDYSRQKFPKDPIVGISGRSLGKFEGALYRVDHGWAIIYNSDAPVGRRRFTIAHEFGHYLMHRQLFPKGIECGEDAVTYRSGEDYEEEADAFAASLLMPMLDCRKQLPATNVPTFADLAAQADRYQVSLISSILRWLEYTERRAMLVISRDDFVLWSSSSARALKTGLFMRTKNAPPREVPLHSLARRKDLADIAKDGIKHPAGVWFDEECTEYTVHADRYDQVISILLFGSPPERSYVDFKREDDTFNKFGQRMRRRFGD